MSLPLLINQYDKPEDMVSDLSKAIIHYYGDGPSPEEKSAWTFLGKNIIEMKLDYPILVEIPLFGLERADLIAVDTRNAIIVEAKGWRNVKRISDMVVLADNAYHIDPCYQLNNYVSKMKFFHTSGKIVNYTGILYMYNHPEYKSDSCKIAYSEEDLIKEIRRIGKPGGKEDIDTIVAGRFTISDDLIDIIIKNGNSIIRDASLTLLSKGYGLSEEQAMIMHRVQDALKNRENKTFLIKGESGSGKTLLALQLLLDAIKNGYKALLAYRNNRLLNTMRQVLNLNAGSVNISSLIQYYSTGRGVGIGERNFDASRYSNMDLIIYDEAQRMTQDVIKMTQSRSNVKVYFYDDSQILIGDEAGTQDNFRRYCTNTTEMHLTGSFRISRSYLQLVRHILWNEKPPDTLNYEINLFDNISNLIEDLRKKHTDGNKIGLLCAFTESKGDKKNPTSVQNRRIGYPLPSNFDLYKNSGLDIYWLMDEKTEYPRYWRGELDPLKYCASVYGAQGFEADYIGLVWGRDLVWRNDWKINADAITDTIGNNYSLKRMAKKDNDVAMTLIRNRYYTLMTRGIRGIDLFFEDQQTGQHIKDVIDRIRKDAIMGYDKL
ncbi:DNA/RNA helicase domain-containing protein [Thermoplasma sp.]|uniref:DNA/RNA helicase domain-containing protein n=1 Tax=Thermoplasma sp. TaxID=1973142 RepID=UPI00261E8F0B|nr:DNA/RNA helicase domain-containing protein [Thermoplasma sp.]